MTNYCANNHTAKAAPATHRVTYYLGDGAAPVRSNLCGECAEGLLEFKAPAQYRRVIRKLVAA